MLRQLILILALVPPGIMLLGCNDGDATHDSGSDGNALYAEPHADGNTFACATCHALSEPAADGWTRPGHPIGDAAVRPTFKNGQLPTLRDAVNNCRRDWMGASDWAADDGDWLALESFLVDQAGDTVAPALAYTIVDPPGDVSGGDEDAGRARFNATCVVCHGQGASGTERAPAIAGTPESPAFIAAKVRRSGNPNSEVYPDLMVGRMPFWAADRLSDDELRDIIQFVKMSPPVDIPVATEGEDLSVPGAQSGCSKSHPAVGRSLVFETHAHAVSGSATIIDDCTIQFDAFGFDGGGIDVHIYGGSGGSYDGGVDLSVNLVGKSFDGAAASLRLPNGITLDDFDGLSVWCVPVGFSFGDGVFQ
jgi:mono/diheme cytochrome c family protein